MEALRAAVGEKPAVLVALQEAARAQACGRCCLRMAAVRQPAAYSSTSLPGSAAEAVAALRGAGEAPAAAAEEQPASGDEGDEAGSKRRRLDQPETAAAASTAGAALCPLCLGLLQLAAPGEGEGAAGADLPARCSFQLALTTSTLNDPQRHAAPIFGPAATAAAAPEPAAAGETAAEEAGTAAAAAAAANAAGRGDQHSALLAPVVTQRALLAPVVTQRAQPAPSLASAAAQIAEEYDFDWFALEVSLPASLAVRHQAFRQQLAQRGEHAAAQAAADAIDVKEAAKLTFGTALASLLGKPLDSSAALRITLTASHPDAAAECGWLAAGSGGGKQRRGRHGRQQQQRGAGSQQEAEGPDVPVLTEAVMQRLAAMPAAEFAAACPPAAAQLAPPAAAATLKLQARRTPLHVGGRYLKLRRGIPQSPWVIDCQRKGEGSVQEAIERAVLPAFQADGYSLITAVAHFCGPSDSGSAGREDIDVRMLGQGRPFILEIHNARRCMPPPEQLRQLEERVLEASAGGVAARGLFAASPAQLSRLKEGEQEKEKSYVAVCWRREPLSDAEVAELEGTRELEVLQQTPIRVLHRRANLERPKLVHGMKVTRLAAPSPPGYFALRLRTQAGTYIKEFVHGDLGRSRPCLGDLLGGCQVQIVSLDVEQVHMEFGAEKS